VVPIRPGSLEDLSFPITQFNGELLFSGLDAAGDFGLWETNGTAAGT